MLNLVIVIKNFMKIKTPFILIVLLCFSCLSEPGTEISFDKTKWSFKEGKDYPYRNSMTNNVLYNDTIRNLTKKEVFNLFGEPDRSKEGYIYYMIAQERLAFWPLHSKFLVFKFKDEYTIEWIKVHE